MARTKTCSHCGTEKPSSEFYSKGDRIDARCKVCVKMLKKERYVAKAQTLGLEKLLEFAELVTELETKLIEREVDRLDKEIERWTKRAKQQSYSLESQARTKEMVSR